MNPHSSTFLTRHLSASTRQAIEKELEKGERSGFVLNLNRDNFLKELQSKLPSSGSARAEIILEKRKTNFTEA